MHWHRQCWNGNTKRICFPFRNRHTVRQTKQKQRTPQHEKTIAWQYCTWKITRMPIFILYLNMLYSFVNTYSLINIHCCHFGLIARNPTNGMNKLMNSISQTSTSRASRKQANERTSGRERFSIVFFFCSSAKTLQQQQHKHEQRNDNTTAFSGSQKLRKLRAENFRMLKQ